MNGWRKIKHAVEAKSIYATKNSVAEKHIKLSMTCLSLIPVYTDSITV